MQLRSITLTKLAEMICGNTPYEEFPYRSSSYLTKFFHGLDLDYAHDGSTRAAWVEGVLEELNWRDSAGNGLPSKELVAVVEHLLHPDHFLDGPDRDADREAALLRVNELLRSSSLHVQVDGVTGLPKLGIAGEKLLVGQTSTGSLRTPALLPDPPADYDVIGTIDYMKAGLLAVLDGAAMPDSEFRRIRKLLIGNPVLPALPSWLIDCRDSLEARDRLIADHQSRAERKEEVRRVLNALTRVLEGEVARELANFDCLGELGHGGFGVVYRYRHRLLATDFAVKVFAPAFNQWDSGNLERFFREARILMRLQHPSIIRFFDVGMLGRRPYLRTEFFEGSTLREYLRDHGTMTPEKGLVLARRMAEALDHAHSRNVVHRDLKPGNVMVAPGEEVRVIDFGLGVLVESDLVSRITKSGEQAAGGIYTAPELFLDPKRIDPATDVYSLGAVWFSALTGQAPSGAGITRWVSEESAVPHAHRVVIGRCLEDPAERYRTAGDLLGDLSQL